MRIRARIVIVSLIAAAFIVPAQSASAAGLCDSEVTTPGTTITLTEDLHCDGRGIIVRTNNVTIDLGGYTMFGSGSREHDPVLGFPAGIAVAGAADTRIIGGTITGFANAVNVMHSNATRIESLVVKETTNIGIILTDSNGIALDSVTVTGNGDDGHWMSGIYGTNVSGFTADNAVISQWSDAGIYMNPVAGFVMSNSTVTENAGEGISVWNARGHVVIKDSTFAKNYDGVMLAHTHTSREVEISNSKMLDNVQHGLYTINVGNSTVLNVTANNNGGEGIWMDSGRDWTYGIDIPFYTNIRGSTANNNRHSGISLSFAGRWWLSDNHAEANGDSGFAFYGGEAILTKNTASHNVLDGFTWEEGSHGSSSGDTSTYNKRNGVQVDTDTKNPVKLDGVLATFNRSTGLLAATGTTLVTKGSYSYNLSDGIRAREGSVNASLVTTYKNGRSGIAFLSGSDGVIEHARSSKNGRYGICVEKTVHIGDVPPHVLLSNAVAPRGDTCTGLIFDGVLPVPVYPVLPRTVFPIPHF